MYYFRSINIAHAIKPGIAIALHLGYRGIYAGDMVVVPGIISACTTEIAVEAS
jgi:hypothetical protein